MRDLIDKLREGYSCVIRNGETRTFSRRGVADLFELLKTEPEFLDGASVADKVVGKGAAALMAIGGIKQLYSEVISTPALALLREDGIAVTFGEEVPAIRNRDGSGFCPLETLCLDEDSPEALLPVIERFIESRKHENTKK